VPAVQFVIPAGDAAAGKERWVRVAKASDVTAEPRRVQVIGDERDAFTVTKGQILGSIWIFREGEAMRAMSATCPHLGCSIDLNTDKKSFGCPCHASRFALLGQPESGPSPRAMDPLATRVVDGWLEIDFRRFRTGITERQEVGA
jgi:cytochrome b6-f complex iron-sulfur subunit/menaquinol-cytochrome c reductase iron-sulfur subunit